MFESLFNTTGSTVDTLSIATVLLTILVAFICGGIISLTYHKTSAKGRYSENFGLTMILLPAVIAIIIMLIGSDIARAFSLAGAFSIIRFRSVPGEPKDIAYVLFAMSAGLACGVAAYVYAAVFTIILCLVMYVLFKTRFKDELINQVKQLIITVPEDMEYESAFEEVMLKYTTHCELKRVKTTALGSLFQLSYELELKQGVSTKAFIDDLRCRNGNLNINLMMATDVCND